MAGEKKLTGYPSIDKPWLKYYLEEAINAPLPECTIYEYLWQNNKDHLNNTALIYYGKRITYGELFQQIDHVASALISAGVKEKEVVTMMVLTQPETIYCMYALNKIGAVACMINVLSSPKEIVHYMAECDSHFLVVLDAFFEKAIGAFNQYSIDNLIYLPMFQSSNIIKQQAYRMKVKRPKASSPNIISWSEFIKRKTTLNSNESNVKKDYKTCALIGHTGGTTGIPKAVMLSDYAINSLVAQYRVKFSYAPTDTFLNTIIPFAVYGFVINIHLPLILGISQIIIPKVDAEKMDILIKKYKPNHIGSIPSYWVSLSHSEQITDLHWLKTAAAGGSGMTPDLERDLNKKLYECGAPNPFLMGYGLSEVCSTACTQVADCAELGSVGIPLVKNVIAAFDPETMEEKKYNETGEICIKSPSTMLGYINNEEENKNMLRTHSDESIWVHTGDLGYISETGSVFIKGRMKRIYLVQYNGALAKIFPDRIEKTILMNCSDVSDCGVVCVSVNDNLYVPIAFVVLSSESIETDSKKDEILKICNEELAEYAVPKQIVFLNGIPQTAMGKVDYRALEEMAKDNVNS